MFICKDQILVIFICLHSHQTTLLQDFKCMYEFDLTSITHTHLNVQLISLGQIAADLQQRAFDSSYSFHF